MKKLLTILLVCCMLLGAVPTVYAAEATTTTTVVDFSKTDVMSDLEGTTINGSPFSEDYFITDPDKIFDQGQDLYVFSAVEYCYPEDLANGKHYAVYLYVYDSTGGAFQPETVDAFVTMGIAFDKDGVATEYAKFALELLNSSPADEFGVVLFHKFRVLDRNIGGKSLIELVRSTERCYSISEIEYTAPNGTRCADEVGTTFCFTGFAKGFGKDADAESTLAGTVLRLDTVTLNVQHTYYRTESSSKGVGYQNQLDTVYFAVPNAYFADGQFLQRIKAEWYEYKTKDIVVTSNKAAYDAILPYVGQVVGDYYRVVDSFGKIYDYQNFAFEEKIGWYLYENSVLNTSNACYSADWAWNLDECDSAASVVELLSSDVLAYIIQYSQEHPDSPRLLDEKGNPLTVYGFTIAAELFEDHIDADRVVRNERGDVDFGYSYYDFDIEADLQSWESWADTNPSFWQNWGQFGFWNTLFGDIPQEDGQTCAPIHVVTKNDLIGTDAQVSNRLFIRAGDVQGLKDYCAVAEKADCTVVLFRFATSDYYSRMLDLWEVDGGIGYFDKEHENAAYRASGSCFLNFDVIQLGFNRNGVYSVIPVAAAPLQIVVEATPPTVDADKGFVDFVGEWVDDTLENSVVPGWLVLVVAILLLLVLFPVLLPLVALLLKVIVFSVRAIMKICVWLFDLIFKRHRSDKEDADDE